MTNLKIIPAFAVTFEPKQFVQPAGDKLNNLVVFRVSGKNVAGYWAGFGWDQTGQFADAAAWKNTWTNSPGPCSRRSR